MRAREIERVIQGLEAAGIPFERDAELARFTTIGLGGPAEVLARPTSTAEIGVVVELARNETVPLRVLGAGSNLLVSDAGVPGIVLHTGALDHVHIDVEAGIVDAGAGCHFPTLVKRTASKGLRGLEGGVGIPGSLGGVLTMNAGAYQFAIGPLVDAVEAVSADKGTVEMRRDEIDFKYRKSSFGTGLIVASARLRLRADAPDAVRADLNAHMHSRKTTQPVGVKSAGCIFKNPDGDSAGRLIDGAGLKGFAVGGARISDVHANFIVHDGSSTTTEVLELIDRVRESVVKATQVELETEVMTWH